MGVLEGLKELKSKHLTWIKVVKNRFDVFATPMSFRDPKIWWILSLLSQGLYTVSIKLHIRAKKVINVSSTNIVGDTWALILSRETQLAPSTRNTFPIKTKKQNIVICPKVSIRWPMQHCLLTESLPQWSLIDSWLLGDRATEATSNNWARPVAW